MDIDPDKFRPIHDSVLVRCDSKFKEHTSSGGIVIPESVGHTEHAIGEVVAVGSGRYHEAGPMKGKFVPTYLKPGDKILFTLEGAEPIHTTDKDHHYEVLQSEIYVLGTL
jgi:co-chaperonin GroES (HSP10)